ncbi:dienelactone hydrolase family protein [Allomuricauda sp. SCSIO 65647]|uniref:carboxylesterase family protein n=1 Tax=Allomuricauda sp. SCSIO 65647 TaxID=2908843 RepID=UPI001F336F2A|nr:dienelactone hydrolase family protein [Muricauda sp. SCSIO 65647]UJH67412.1 dienelactone hydrolase family protein [Muricauda sp. SCSIO 65647]
MKVGPLLFSVLFLVACSQSDGESPPEIELPPTEEVEKSVLFDPEFSDLHNLPADQGGEHRSYPLTLDSDFRRLGYFAYIPGGYDDNEYEYPLLLFLHGSGQKGNSLGFPPGQLDRVLEHGPPKLIESGDWNPPFPFLVVSPQTEGDWFPDTVHRFIEFLIEEYRVNTKRIYLTGLSMGGRGCWFYEGTKGSESYAAALVPICGRGPTPKENLIHAPIWAFHGEEDNVVPAFENNGSVQMVTQLNANDPRPKFDAKLTLFPNVGHDSWERTYDDSGMGTENSEYDAFDISIYDWMLQYRIE